MRSCILYISSFLIFFPSFSFAFICPNIPMCSPSTGVDEICNLHLSSSDTTLITVTRVDSDYTVLARVFPLAFPYLHTPSTNNRFAVFSPSEGSGNSYRWRAKHATSCPVTCYDQLQNGDETGTDCGGLFCSPCGCFNGSMDDFETGIDCGGTCQSPCEPSCPPGSELIPVKIGDDPTPIDQCIFDTPPDSYGNCPSGYTYIPSPTSPICMFSADPSWASPNIENQFENYPSPPEGFSTPSSSTSSSTSSDWTPDPSGASGAGTLTTTETTTSTISSGSSTTNNLTTNYYYSGDGAGGPGQLTGSDSSSSSTSNDPTDDPSNYDYSYKNEGKGFNSDIDFSLLPEAKTLDSFGSFVSSNNPVSVLTEDMKLTANGTCSFSLPTPYGSMSLDFCHYTWVINIMGAALVFCSYLFALFIIFA